MQIAHTPRVCVARVCARVCVRVCECDQTAGNLAGGQKRLETERRLSINSQQQQWQQQRPEPSRVQQFVALCCTRVARCHAATASHLGSHLLLLLAISCSLVLLHYPLAIVHCT